MSCARLLGIGMLAIGGCGRSDGLPVAGRITIDGRPVDLGLVTFEPAVPTDSAVGASIKDGMFATEIGRGVHPGAYRVTVKALRRTGKRMLDRLSNQMVDELVIVKVVNESSPITISAETAQALDLNFSEEK